MSNHFKRVRPAERAGRHSWPVLALIAFLTGCAAQGKNIESGQRASSGGTGSALNVNADASTALTCADAAERQSYLGCDFWPTVTLNPVWSTFDFAAVVANVGNDDASVDVQGPTGSVASAIVPAHGLVKLFLPWVPALKGSDFDNCTNWQGSTASVFVTKGAFHLTSTNPVIVNQFNALEFRGVGGPPQKNWRACPGDQSCDAGTSDGCYSFSNDASILLPTTALTGNYRITTKPAGDSPSYFAITGTTDQTTVAITLSATAKILGGPSLAAGGPGETVQVALNAGDVVEVVGFDETADLSGSLVKATHPVQVIAGAACAALPSEGALAAGLSCDHLEETVLPAETLGKRYIVTQPTGALGTPVAQRIRLYGNADGTTLTYPGGAPIGAPTHLDAGQVVDVTQAQKGFEVDGDHEFAVGIFLLSAGVADPDDLVQRGDPSQSQAVTVDQYRTQYVFLAPDDYDVNYVDIIMPLDAQVVLDGQPMPGSPAAIEGTAFGVSRVRLGAGDGGVHTLTSDKPVGLQILGYGSYTSYQYPGGLDLKRIAPSPK
jgi:IgGFc binding protein